MSQQPSFTIKSSYKLINPQQNTNPITIEVQNKDGSKQQLQKGWTTIDTDHKKGSDQGMMIRTNNTSAISDFY